jgi:OmpA-OmpF porin, OOP family
MKSFWLCRGFAVCAMAALTMGAIRAQDEEPAKDHPSVPRFPGYVMDDGKSTDFDSFDFQIGGEKTKTVEGRSWRFGYHIKEGARKASGLEIIRNYENQFKARGGRLIYKDPGNSEATIMMPLGAGERWFHISMNNDTEQLMINIIESAAMKQKVEFTADEMAEQLASSGRIALQGILFATAKTDIEPESAAVLDEVTALLKKDSELKVRIEGHTDNVGAKPANLTLSRGRAAAVKAALVSRGIPADRLASEGFGDTKPVADNSTEEGRKQNRRVELVKQ